MVVFLNSTTPVQTPIIFSSSLWGRPERVSLILGNPQIDEKPQRGDARHTISQLVYGEHTGSLSDDAGS